MYITLVSKLSFVEMIKMLPECDYENKLSDVNFTLKMVIREGSILINKINNTELNLKSKKI